MAALFTGKLIGATAAFAPGTATGIIATKDITLDSDDMIRWTDANGKKRAEPVTVDLANLLREVFTGTGGATHRFME